MLDGEAEEGDTFTFENLVFTVKKTDGKRIEKVEVEEILTSDEEEDED